MLSLAAIAAIAAMAFVGTSSAFAEKEVVLCESPELECEHPWPNPTTIVAHAIKPTLLSSVGTVECEKSLVELTLLNTLAKLILGHILSLSFEGNCHLGSTKCEVTVKETGAVSSTHGANKLEWTGVAVPLSLGATSMNSIANVHCGFLINCTYEGTEKTKSSATNGPEGDITLVFNKAELARKEGFCPATSEWDATYLTLLGGLWLES